MDSKSITTGKSIKYDDSKEIILPINNNCTLNPIKILTPNSNEQRNIFDNNNITVATRINPTQSHIDTNYNYYEPQLKSYDNKKNLTIPSNLNKTDNNFCNSAIENVRCNDVNDDLQNNEIKSNYNYPNENKNNLIEMKRTSDTIEPVYHLNDIKMQDTFNIINKNLDKRITTDIYLNKNKLNISNNTEKQICSSNISNKSIKKSDIIQQDNSLNNNDLNSQNINYVLDRKLNEALILNLPNQLNRNYNMINDNINNCQLNNYNNNKKNDGIDKEIVKNYSNESVIKSNTPNQLSELIDHQKFTKYMYDSSITKSSNRTLKSNVYEKKKDNEVSSSNFDDHHNVYNENKTDYNSIKITPNAVIQKAINFKENINKNVREKFNPYQSHNILSTPTTSNTSNETYSNNLNTNDGIVISEIGRPTIQQNYYYQQNSYDNNQYSNAPLDYGSFDKQKRFTNVGQNLYDNKLLSTTQSEAQNYKWNSKDSIQKYQSKPDSNFFEDEKIENNHQLINQNNNMIEYSQTNLKGFTGNKNGHYFPPYNKEENFQKITPEMNIKDSINTDSVLHFNKKNRTNIPPYSKTKTKSLLQLQMKPPDFSKIIKPTIENDKILSKDLITSNKNSFQITPQNFKEMSKKYNYITDLQLKDQSNKQTLEYDKKLLKKNQILRNQPYSNLYVKTPDFCAENFKKIDDTIKNQHPLTNINMTNNTISLNTSNDNRNVININKFPQLSQDVEMSVVLPKVHGTFVQKSGTFNENYEKPRSEIFDKECYHNNNSIGLRKNHEMLQNQNFNHKIKSTTQLIDSQNNDIRSIYSHSGHISQNNDNKTNNIYEEIDCSKKLDSTNAKKLITKDLHNGTDRNVDYNTNNNMQYRLNFIDEPERQTNQWYGSGSQQISSNAKQQIGKVETTNYSYTNLQSSSSSSLISNKTYPSSSQMALNLPSSKIPPYSWPNNPIEKRITQSPITSQIRVIQSPIFNQQSTQAFLSPSPRSSPSSISGNIYSSRSSPQTPLNVKPNFKENCYAVPMQAQPNFIANTEKNYTDKINPDIQTQHMPNIKRNDTNEFSSRLYKKSANALPIATNPIGRGSSEIIQHTKSQHKPNYREMINHVYAMRNSTSEDDLNLEIIKRTLNCDISLRKSDNDLSKNIFDSPAVIPKSNIITAPDNSTNFNHMIDEKRKYLKKNYTEIDKFKNPYPNTTTELDVNIQPIAYGENDKTFINPMIPRNDISVTLSKISKISSGKRENCKTDVQSKLISSDVKISNLNMPTERVLPISVSGSLQIKPAESTTNKTHFTTPLDLSVKTIKTKADSTGCDDTNNNDTLRYSKNFNSAFKVDFCPNFSNANSLRANNIKINNNNNNSSTSHTFSHSSQTNVDKTISRKRNFDVNCDSPNDQKDYINSNLITGSYPHKLIPQNQPEIKNIKSNTLPFLPVRSDINCTKYKKPHKQTSSIIDQKVEIQHDNQIQLKGSPFLPSNSTKSPISLPPTFDYYASINKNKNQNYCENTNYDISLKYEQPYTQKAQEHNIPYYKRNDEQQNYGNIQEQYNKSFENNFQQKRNSYENQLAINYSNRKRTDDLVKYLPEKKLKLDDGYMDHLGGSGYNQQSSSKLNKSETISVLGYKHLPSQKAQQQVWYPPSYSNDLKNIQPNQKLGVSSSEQQQQQQQQQSVNLHLSQQNSVINQLTIPINNPIGPKKADQDVISKLKNSLEMRDFEKRKNLIKPINNIIKKCEPDIAITDMASLLAARIRTKGELKGFNAIPVPIKNSTENSLLPNNNKYSEIKSLEQQPPAMETNLKDENNSSLNLLDWGSACNDFVEQLKCDANKKRGKKSFLSNYKQEKCKDIKKGDNFNDIVLMFDLKMKTNKSTYKHNVKEVSNSSDEDKPLLLLCQPNLTDENSTSFKRTKDNKISNIILPNDSVNKNDNSDLSLIKSTSHSTIVEKLSEKIGRNIREKQRIEQEKRLAARIGKGSSSESEDNSRIQRPKKSTKKSRSRTSNGPSAREVSESDSSETAISNIKGYKKNVDLNLTNIKKEQNITLDNETKIKLPEINPINSTNIDSTKIQIITEKREVMTKAEMKFMIPSNKILIEKITDGSDSEQSNSSKSKNKILTNLKEQINDGVKNDRNKLKSKKLSDNRNIQKAETMTRSKKRKELEKQMANSKILRNDKIIKNTLVNRKTKTTDKTIQVKNRKTLESIKNIYNLKKNSINLKNKTDQQNLNKVKVKSSSSSSAHHLFEKATLSCRLRSKRSHEKIIANNTTLKLRRQLKEKHKEKRESKKLQANSLNQNKKTAIKITLGTENIEEKQQNITKFPPGWEHQVYEYKKSLKVPLSLITIKGPPCHRISTSLPDLDSYSSDCNGENNLNTKKKKLIRHKSDVKDSNKIVKSIKKEKPNNFQQRSSTDNISVEMESNEITQYPIAPKSIIDVLHSRVIKNKKIPTKQSKILTNSYESKIIPRSNNCLEILTPPTIKKPNEPHSVFQTEVLKSRTRTESRILKNKELIREVFGGEERSASAPPEIRNVDLNAEKLTFEEKYEQYLEKMNVDFGERIRKVKLQTDEIVTNQIDNQLNINQFIKKEKIDDDDDESKEFNEIELKQNYKTSICIKTEIQESNGGEQHLRTGSGRDDVVTPQFLKRKKINKNYRRKGSSGFDYIRKKKRPTSNVTGLHSQENLRRRKILTVELHHARAENDVNKEIHKWVLNKSVGQSALHKAARLGYLDVIVYCLERMGMNPNPKDNAGYTPLHEACSKGRIDIARVLLQYGANHSETAHSGIRPLHEASENGYVEIVRLLLSYGADPLLTTYSGQTPLMLAENNEMEQFMKSHLNDVQNTGPHKQPWKFPGPWKIFDEYECGFDVLNGAPEIDDDFCDIEMFERITDSKNKNTLSLFSKSSIKCDLNLNIMNSNKIQSTTTTTTTTANILNEKFKKIQKDVKSKKLTSYRKQNLQSDDNEIFELEEADMPLPPLYLLKDEGSEKWVLLSDLCSLLKVKSKDTLLKQICPTTPQLTLNKDLLRELKMSDFLEKATCLQLLCAGEKLNIHASKVILIKYNEKVQSLLGVKSILMQF